MIDAGKYLARASKGELSESGQKKTPCVAVEFQLETGEFLWWYGYLTENAEERTLESLRLAGFTGLDISGDLKAQGLGSRDVELVIEHETYEGKTYARIKWVNDPNGKGGSAMPDDKKAAFAARMRGKLLAMGGRDAPAAAPAAGRNGGAPF